MKKIMPWLIGLFVLLATAGCSEQKPTPQERFRAYLQAWQQQDFSAMYEKLTTKAKQQISKKKFIERYETIFHDFEITDLSVTANFKNKEEEKIDPDEDGKVRLPFTVKMESFAGPIEFTEKAAIIKEKRKEKTNWYVHWTTKMIFPQIKNPNVEIHGHTLPSQRGKIIDRKGRPLAVNGTIASIGIWPAKLQPGSKEQLSRETGIPLSVIEEKLNASWVQANSFVPVKQFSAGQKEQYVKLLDIPGVRKKEVEARVYPYGKSAAHLIGYIGPISAEELKKLKDKGYDKTDKIGKRGLEELYEDRLNGEDGGIVYTTDANGNRLEVVAKKPPKHGETIQLTINALLQQRLYKEMKGDAGTAAAIDPKTGEVLALVSAPSFDPNRFILGISEQRYKALTTDPQHPLRNRFNQAYAPGSSFKPITAAIGLKTGVIDPSNERHISGATWQPDDPSWGNYHVTRVNENISSVNLQKALVYSDNIYFAQTALRIGAQKFLTQAKQFGFGERLPFPYPIEKAQLTNDGTFDGSIQLANSGYGQGEVLTSTLQLAVAYTPFVTGGNLLKPTLELKKEKAAWHKNVITPDIANTIVKDLIQVVQSPHGTGNDAEMKGITIAGKTGTAELKNAENGKENGWFVAFNTENPQILIAMMIEKVQDRHGSHYVVPKVADVLKWYLK